MTDAPRQYHRYTPEERTKKIEEIIGERFNTGKPWDQIAKNHNIDRTTLIRWKMTDEWQQIEAQWRKMRRNELRVDVQDIAPSALQVLQDLMHGIAGPGEKVGSFTRFSAAKFLIETLGLDQEIEEQKVDQADDLLDFLKAVGREQHLPQSTMAPHLTVEVLDGGRLPPIIVEANDRMYQEIRADQDALEAEFKYISEHPETDDPPTDEAPDGPCEQEENASGSEVSNN